MFITNSKRSPIRDKAKGWHGQAWGWLSAWLWGWEEEETCRISVRSDGRCKPDWPSMKHGCSNMRFVEMRGEEEKGMHPTSTVLSAYLSGWWWYHFNDWGKTKEEQVMGVKKKKSRALFGISRARLTEENILPTIVMRTI